MPKDEYITLEQAQTRLLENTPTVQETETLPLDEALGRVLHEDLRARIHQPPFDRSPLDGYALLHADTASASPSAPARLRITQRLYAGDAPTGPLQPGEAARLMTGAMLPPGASCVIRQEDVREEDGIVYIPRPMKEHENYIFHGEDVAEGELLLRRGELLEPAALGVLAGQGYTQATVCRAPRVALISGGDELAPRGMPLPPGKIYDSNAVLLSGRVRSLGGIPTQVHCADDPDTLAETIEALMEHHDLIITTGGVSVGEKDFMPTVGRRIGGELLFRGVGIKPGGPALATNKNGRMLICLSGNPFAAAATFELLAAPVLCKLAGRAHPLPQRAKAIVAEGAGFGKSSPGRRFLRARVAGCSVHIPDGHASGMLASLIGCNCLVDVPAASPPIQAGAEVELVLML